MLKKVISPFTLFIQEIRRDNAFRHKTESKKIKKLMLGAMGQSCIVLFGLLVLYYILLAHIGVMIVNVEPLRLTMIAVVVLVIWGWTSISKKFLIKNKTAYLKKEHVYEDYRKASEHLD